MKRTSAAAWPSDWFAPDWPAPARVRALMTTRHGGVSPPPWDSLNLGDHVGDAPPRVAANRQRLQAALGGARPVFLQQVHGWQIAHLHTHKPEAEASVADAALTTQSGLACTVMVADCLPVLVAHRSARLVAAAHAGWRGLAGQDGHGVLEQLFQQIHSEIGVDTAPPTIKNRATRTPPASPLATTAPFAPQDWLVWLGPCIGPQAFETGPEVRAAFLQADAGAHCCFTRTGHGRELANLPELARRRLQRLGITAIYGNDGSASWCTVSQPQRFFSHRRDTARLGASGRQAACIWLA